MIFLVLVLVLAVLSIIWLAYAVGVRLGGQSCVTEAHRVRAEAAAAERLLHDLTRSAFVAMAEAAETRRAGRHP